MAALKAIRLSFSHENERKKDEEEKEEFVKFFLLEVYSSFLFKGFFKVELDYGVYGLESCLFRDLLLLVMMMVIILQRANDSSTTADGVVLSFLSLSVTQPNQQLLGYIYHQLLLGFYHSLS